jgi:putative membrane protein
MELTKRDCRLKVHPSDLKKEQRYTTMATSPYSKFDNCELILRDELAIDRTILANERTLLAYLRSGVSLLIAGVSMMHFSQEGWFQAVGVACIPVGVITGIFGLFRYRTINRSISAVRRQLPKLSDVTC